MEKGKKKRKEKLITDSWLTLYIWALTFCTFKGLTSCFSTNSGQVKRKALQDQRLSSRWEHSSERCVPKQTLSKFVPQDLQWILPNYFLFPHQQEFCSSPFPELFMYMKSSFSWTFISSHYCCSPSLGFSFCKAPRRVLQRNLPYLPWIWISEM